MSSTNPRIPEPTRPYRHHTPIQVRFNDADMFGHINNAICLQFFDLGKLRYFEDVIGKDFMKEGFSALVVNINCDFYAPAFMDEPLEVVSAVIHLGEKSITLEQRLIDSVTGDVKCQCRTIMAGFDNATMTSTPIPQRFRHAIEIFEEF